MSSYNENDEEEPSFLEKYRFVIVALVVLIIVSGVGLVAHFFTGTIPPPRKPQEITISLPPPPPPPPPPPTPPPPKPPPPEQKIVQVTPVKPNDKPKTMAKAPDHAPGPSGPKGPSSADGTLPPGGGGGGQGDGEGAQNAFDAYAGELHDAVVDALSKNNTTSHASIHHMRIKVWINSTGRVTRAAPVTSSGDPSVDEALKNQALVGIQLADPPPTGKNIAFEMYIDAVRPN